MSSQSQGSVERANRNVEEIVQAWTSENNSTQWAEGLRFVQFQKNNGLHSDILQSPFEALFGRKATLDLRGSALPSVVIASLRSEEDLENVTVIYRSVSFIVSRIACRRYRRSNRTTSGPST